MGQAQAVRSLPLARVSTIKGIDTNIRLGADKSNVPTFTNVALANQRLFFTAPMRGINQSGLFEFDAATRQIKIILSTGVEYLGRPSRRLMHSRPMQKPWGKDGQLCLAQETRPL